jgi:hypothetical protein
MAPARPSPSFWLRSAAFLAVACGSLAGFTAVATAQAASVKRVQVIGTRSPVEIEIEASDPLVPQTQLLTGPDRLVVDLPNTLPAAQLHNKTLNQGEIKNVRVSLYSAKPPMTRLVFDLSGPQTYQVFPSGRTVIIKLGGPGTQSAAAAPSNPISSGSASLMPASATPRSVSHPPAALSSTAIRSSKSGPQAKLVPTNYPVQAVLISTPPPAQPAPPPLAVSYKNGQLSISSNKATLSEVLFAIHQRTGAEIAIPAGAEQERVVAELGPAPPSEVLSSLLNGSKFNFLILSSASDPSALDRVILSPRPEGPAPAYRPLPPVPVQPSAQDEDDADTPARTPPPAPAPHPNAGPEPNAGPQPNSDNKPQDNSQD